MSEERSLFEAEALAALERAQASAKATENALSDAAAVLRRAGREHSRDAEKVRELVRLASVRLDVFARRLAEGPADSRQPGQEAP